MRNINLLLLLFIIESPQESIWLFLWGDGETGEPGGKPLEQGRELNPRVTPSPGAEPGPHWWEGEYFRRCAIPATPGIDTDIKWFHDILVVCIQSRS